MRKGIFIGFVLLMLILTGYVYWFYYRPYSNDELREGYFQRFSRRGNIFKTYEGELVQEGFGKRTLPKSGPVSANYFYFSVVDEQIADSLEHCVGKVIKVHCTQYHRSLPWRGDNYNGKNQDPGQYIVDRIDMVID